MLSDLSLLLLLLLVTNVISKPIDSTLPEDVNEIDTGIQRDYKSLVSDFDVTEVGEVPKPFRRSSTDETASNETSISEILTSKTTDTNKSYEKRLENSENVTTAVDNTSTRQQGFDWILTPFIQKLQFSPETFFQDRIGQVKDTLSHLGSIFPNHQRDDGDTKQFLNSGAVQNLVGLNDSGFSAVKLDPAGFFGGNGWFANKGGILGGPGAFISTGSLLTDYPTPYKK